MVFYSILIIIISVLLSSTVVESAQLRKETIPKDMLEVRIDIEDSTITGIFKTTLSRHQELSLNKGSLDIIQVRLNNKSVKYNEEGASLFIKADEDGAMEIKYRVSFNSKSSTFSDDDIIQDVIDERGVFLTGIWYPQRDEVSHIRLKVILPRGYEAISEAEEIEKVEDRDNVKFYFNFPYPVEAINLIATNKYKIIRGDFNGIEIYAYFFNEDINLAETYIEYTKRYLRLYEDLIGRYPYRRFSIVENFLPTGYSMPTFTLLGSAVVKLPFIVETSLGHEILHQWFGNMVYIDYDSGNWSEGLTTYLSDHLYQEQQGKGWEYRKRLLLDYESYVDEDSEFSLIEFLGRFDDTSKAIGYGKSSMVFHMIKNLLGEEAFLNSLKDFISEYRFTEASWDDLRLSFEKYYKKDLAWFFKQWVDGKGLPDLELKDVKLKYLGGGYELNFKLKQEGDNIFRLDVPLTLYSGGKGFKRFFSLSERVRNFKIYISERPERIVLDEDYDIARRLDRRETPPTVSRLLGGKEYLLALPVENREDYEYIINSFNEKGAVLKKAVEIKESEIKSSTFIILGSDNPIIRKLYGRLEIPDEGFSVIVKKNPWDEEKVVGIFSGRSREEIEAGFKKISHYGKYSKLVFKDGRNIKKETDKAERGVSMEIFMEPVGIDVSSISSLSDIVDNIADKKIVYVGEFHDQYAHHTTQLEIIRRLYEKNKRIAIGMEIFQRPFQEVLDAYIEGRISEREFLKRSEYYKRWRFDFNLYKPILDFAVSKGIPVVALNMQEEIIDKVSKNGMDSLTDEEKVMLPLEMDFSDLRYKERLMDVFKQHKDWKEKNFNYFYQSQTIWDETMAESIDKFLRENPDYQMVVIAGQGHLEYGSGIPRRTYRRNGYDYAIVLLDANTDQAIADYILFPEQIEAPSSPMLMVYLKTEEGKVKITGFPEDSVSENAGLRAGDIIITIDDIPINSIEDIKLHLFYKKRGDVVRVKALRREEDFMKEMEFRVRLK